MLTEIIDLPSKGNLYPKDHPLSDGKIEIKYMTAREEDILTNQSYIENDIVLDKLLESVIVNDNINHKDLIVGDKEKVLLQTRIFGYGSDYSFKYEDNEENINKHDVDLSSIGETGKPELFDNSPFIDYELEIVEKTVTVKIPNGHDIDKLVEEMKAIEDAGSTAGSITLRLSHIIQSIDGVSDEQEIREFSKKLPARDSMKLRMFLNSVSPDIDLSVDIEGEEVEIPLGINFFWPTAEI